jgi:hypothetical protein
MLINGKVLRYTLVQTTADLPASQGTLTGAQMARGGGYGVKAKPVAKADRLDPGAARCEHLPQPHAGLFQEPVGPAPETKETGVEGRHMSRCPARR